MKIIFDSETFESIQALEACKTLGTDVVMEKLSLLIPSDVKEVCIREYWNYERYFMKPCILAEILIRKTKEKGVYRFAKRIYDDGTVINNYGKFEIIDKHIVFIDDIIKTGIEAYYRFSGSSYLAKFETNLLEDGDSMKIAHGSGGCVWYAKRVHDPFHRLKCVFIKEDKPSGKKIETQSFFILD